MEFKDDDQLVRPTLCLELLHKDSECQCEAEGVDEEEEGREWKNQNNIVPNLKVKIAVSYNNMEGGGEKEDEDEDGFKTPTSCEHKIPVMLECPPAPRKPPPTLSSRKKKRKSHCLSPNFLLHSLFPASPLSDLDGNIKKKLKHMQITPFTHM